MFRIGRLGLKLGLLVLLAVGCNGISTSPSTTVPHTNGASDVAPTQSPTIPTAPSATIAQATATISFSTPPPSRICLDAPPPRLSINGSARVSDEDPRVLNLRDSPGLSDEDVVIGTLAPGTFFAVLDGPVCADGYVWYAVRLQSGREGWIAEGEIGLYYVEPYPPE